MPRIVPVKIAELYAEQMRKPGLVFVTQANQASLKERAEKFGKQLPEDELGKKLPAEYAAEAIQEMQDKAKAEHAKNAPALKLVKTESQEPVKTESDEAKAE
jgi:hypothetical protein